MVKCDKCHEPSETVCPTTHTVVATMTISRVQPGQPMVLGAQSTQVIPLPFQTTVYLCQKCNKDLLAIELTEGPRDAKQMAAWMAHPTDVQDRNGNVLHLGNRNPKGAA